MSTKLLALGSIYLDINCPDVPFGQTSLETEEELATIAYSFEPGGSATNFARQSTTLGLETAVLGKIGNDEPGQLVASLLHVSDPAVSTNIGINLSNNQYQTLMVAAGTANQALRYEEIIEQIKLFLEDLQYLYIGGCFKLDRLLPDLHKVVAAAKSAGAKTVLDHARLVQDTTVEQIAIVRRLALSVDYYLPSRAEFLELWEVDSIETGLQKIHRQGGHSVVIVKDGSNGASIYIHGGILKVPAYGVTPLGTVGAGDSFNAGFIAAREQAMDLQACINFACATAALKISRPTLPTAEEVHVLARSR